MKVLVATDGSKLSLDAIEAFASRLRWFREPPEIELVHVHPPIPVGRAVAWAGKEAVDRYYAEESAEALKPAEELLARREIAFRAVRLVGEPGLEIVAHAESSGSDLIVIGSRGQTAMANLVMGSVATKVLAASKLPVLVLR
jgi:nucleotide-binding universal stress UspA family protein